jgi:hypothetical protein
MPRTQKDHQVRTMKTREKLLLTGAAAVTLLFGGCTGGYYGPSEGPYYGGHYYYGQSFGARHFYNSDSYNRGYYRSNQPSIEVHF